MGGPDIEEAQATPEEIERIKIAEEQWARFEETGKPLISEYTRMATGYDVDEEGNLSIVENGLLNADGSVRTDTSQATAATEQAYAPGMARVNPNSGQYHGGLNDLQASKLQSGAESAAGTQLAQHNRQLKGLENVTAMGRGEETDAIQGLSQLANNANQKAQRDAERSFANASANRHLAGTVAGTAAGMSLGKRSAKKGGQGLTGLFGG